MRKLLFTVLIFATALQQKLYSQLTGVKTIGVDYPTLAAAVTALNTSGVGAGGCTINLPAGYTETAPLNGIQLGSTVLNASLSSANQLFIKKNGTGVNPVLLAFTGGTGTTRHGIFIFRGVDYVTIDAIDLVENPSNSGNALMEWGFALVNLNSFAPMDGCQYITIQNCAITLNRFNPIPGGCAGIYSRNHIASNISLLLVNLPADLHSYNKFYGNTISNVNQGIYISGGGQTITGTNQSLNNDVGGNSPATGNRFVNMGVSGNANGRAIFLHHQTSPNASFNTIDNAAGGAINGDTEFMGIYFQTNGPVTANNNNITITSSGSTYHTAAIYNVFGKLTALNNNINLVSTGGSAPYFGIYNWSGESAIIDTNHITATGTGPCTSNFYFFYNETIASTSPSYHAHRNTISNVSLSTTGQSAGFYNQDDVGVLDISKNSITNITRTAASGTHYGIATGSPGTSEIHQNKINGAYFTSAGTTGSIFGIYGNSSFSQIRSFDNNIQNFSTIGTGSVYGIAEWGSPVKDCQRDTISNLSSSGGTVAGLSFSTNNVILTNNIINTLAGNGSPGGTGGEIIGIEVGSGSDHVINRNKIYDLSTNASGAIVSGMKIAGGRTIAVYNNIIGDLRAPYSNSTIDVIRGISLLSQEPSSSARIEYNTTYLNAFSSGSDFATSGLYHTVSATATTANLILKNNLIYNNSQAKGNGKVTAFRRSNGGAGMLANFSSQSNNNLFYAGLPSASQLIYFDGISSAQTLSDYKSGVFPAGTIAPRDNLSVTEIVSFLSTTGSSPQFAHINPAAPTLLESRGIPVTWTTDFDGDSRNPSTPDIGADEFNGIPANPCNGTPLAGNITGTAFICAGSSVQLSLAGNSSGPDIYTQWQSSNSATGPFTDINAANGNSYNTGTISTPSVIYFRATINCLNNALNSSTPVFSLTVNPIPTANPVSNLVVCNGASTGPIDFTGSLAGTVYNWTNSQPSIGLAASGFGNIASFNAINTGTTVLVATITVTPVYTSGISCSGIPISFTITVNPATTIICPANISVNAPAGTCSAVVNFPPAIANGVPAPAVSYSIPSGSLFPVGITSVTATATNSCGSQSCTFTISVLDTQSPVINCPSNITVNSSAGLCSAVVNYTVSATDNCAGVIVTRTSGPGSGSSFPLGVTTVTHTATDASGNISTCSFTVTVNDSQPPSISSHPSSLSVCPGNAASFSVTAVNGSTYQWQILNGSTWNDIPGATNSTYTINSVSSSQSGSMFRVIVTGTCNQVISNPATLTVNSAATIICPANISANAAASTCGAIVNFPPAIANGVPAPTISYSIPSGSLFPVGITSVTINATNSCGTASCSFTVQVNDLTPPVITCPAGLTASPVTGCTAIVNYSVTATDQCSATTITRISGPASGSPFPLGVTTVTHTATDASGNTSTCSFTVTVNDSQLPSISSHPSSLSVCPGNAASFSVVAVNGSTYQWQVLNGSAWNNIPGATNATYTINNAGVSQSGNMFRVIVTGTCNQVISNPATLTVHSITTVTLSANPLTSLLPGQTATLTAVGNPTGGTYSWLYNGVLIQGAGSSNLGPLTVSDLGDYTVRYTVNGCIANSAVLTLAGGASTVVWIFPNPNIGQFSIRFDNTPGQPVIINVHNSLGQLVYRRKMNSGSIPYSAIAIDLGLTPSGIYIVSLLNNSSQVIAEKKILVQN